jgi:hypothetical protein
MTALLRYIPPILPLKVRRNVSFRGFGVNYLSGYQYVQLTGILLLEQHHTLFIYR